MNVKWLAILLATLPLGCSSAKESTNPEEVGDTAWQRSYPEAITEAKKSKKPIFLLFQEVPG